VFAFGVLDTGYHWNLTDEEAHQLARKSIYHATYRDFASGGLIRGKLKVFFVSFTIIVNVRYFIYFIFTQFSYIGHLRQINKVT
jgi:20S proteasome, alpha and beta subunits